MLIGDSQCTIACMEADNRILDIWFANRVAEVQDRIESWKRKGIKVNDFYHWPGVTNVADLATKGRAKTLDVAEDSVWQNGPIETRYPVENWPINRDFVRAIPEEEKRAAIYGVHVNYQDPSPTGTGCSQGSAGHGHVLCSLALAAAFQEKSYSEVRTP